MKCDNNEQSSKQCFKIGHKFSSEEKAKNINKRTSHSVKIKKRIKMVLEENKGNKEKKNNIKATNARIKQLYV